MFYEDVTVARGDTVSKLGAAYGYKAAEWKKIWDSVRNAALVEKRQVPEKLQVGDVLQVPIPWCVVKKKLTRQADGGLMTAERNGELGERLSWVQTVYRHNQPIGPNPDPFCVDACTPDDALPFYWTESEIKNDPSLRRTFSDHSSRNAPTVKQGTTRWRAVLSLCVVTGKRVTVWNSLVWGWDMTPASAVTTVGPRAATSLEVAGHLNLLRKGLGMGPQTFGKQGWSFRTPPA